ncbi:MAG: PAC2 family protein [Actinomycetes bacterium]
MLDVDTWPDLRDPVLVLALSGWVDAGSTGALAADRLREQMVASRVFARLDLADLVDLQQTRPEVSITAGTSRRIAWPVIEFVAGRAGRDVVLCSGPEPSLRWPSLIAEVVALATRLGVREAYGLGAMPAVVTHRRPVPVLSTVTSAALADGAGVLREDYEGATGLQTALLVSLGAVGISGTGLWAQVPHYLAGSPSPPAVRAVLERLVAATGVVCDTTDLAREAEVYNRRVDDGLVDRPDVADLVDAIETEHPQPAVAEIPTADDLAAEIEEFLHRLDGLPGPSDEPPGDPPDAPGA